MPVVPPIVVFYLLQDTTKIVGSEVAGIGLPSSLTPIPMSLSII